MPSLRVLRFGPTARGESPTHAHPIPMVVDYRAETAWLDSILQPGQQHPEGAQGEEDHDDMLDDDDDDDLGMAGGPQARPRVRARAPRARLETAPRAALSLIHI